MSVKQTVDDMARAAGMTPPADRTQQTLVDGSPVTADHRELKENGQQKGYVVLSPAERARGFVRPVRRTYVHVGTPGPKYPLRDLTPEERETFHADESGYVKYEVYPRDGSHGSALGHLWTQAALDKIGQGCGVATTMALPLAETYPGFYGATFCCGCRTHLPVGQNGEFVWADSSERVGT